MNGITVGLLWKLFEGTMRWVVMNGGDVMTTHSTKSDAETELNTIHNQTAVEETVHGG